MTDKTKLKNTLTKAAQGFDRVDLSAAASSAARAQSNATETKANAIVNEVVGGVQSLTSKFDKFQGKLNSTTAEGLLSDTSKTVENLTSGSVNELVSSLSGAFGSKVEVTFTTVDGILIPNQSSLDATGGVSGTAASVLQQITGLGVSAGSLQKSVMDASPDGLLKVGQDLKGKIGAFTSSTINSLAEAAVSSVTNELETELSSITDINRTMTLPSSIDGDSTSPTFGDITNATFTATNMPTGDSEFSAAIKNIKTDPLNSLSNVVTTNQEIKQNLTGTGQSDFAELTGKNGSVVLDDALQQQTLRNRYQALADEKNSLIQARTTDGIDVGIVQGLGVLTLTSLFFDVKKFAPKLSSSKVNQVIALSQGDSQEFELAVDLLFDATGKPAAEIRAFLKEIDTTITRATAPNIEQNVFGEPYVIGSFLKQWNSGLDDPVFPYVSSVEELQAELRNVKREVTEVVVHWTETPTNKNIGSEEINETHLESGLNGIGYHYVIRRDGSLQRGRPVNLQGQHADDHDTRSIAVVFVGGINVPSETRNIEDFISVQSLTRSQFNTFDHFCRAFYNTYPGGQILGHSDIDDLANDPGFDVRAYVKANFDKDSKFTTPLTQGPFTVSEINS
jgi:hypothetical protein